MTATLFKVYCYRGKDKQIWYEVECDTTGQGVAWSPARATVIKKAEKLGYVLTNKDKHVVKFYRTRTS
jgi:hypothetical protein